MPRARIRLSRARLLARLMAVVTLVALLPAPSASAQALPPNAWWYTELSLPEAWKVSQGQGVVVAVVDSGVKATLGDLRGQVLAGTDFVAAGGDGRQETGTADNPQFGHGSDIAALIAGTGNGAGLVGVAPKARILPVRVDNNPGGQTLAAAIRWSVDHAARIINLSLVGEHTCPSYLQDAVSYAVSHDVIVVASTGDSPNLPVGAPASCVGAIAVGGIEPGGGFVPWSEEASGPELDFVAPANHLQSLSLDDRLTGPRGFGVSFATAFVSGTFALLRAKFPHESARQIVTRALWNVHNGLGGKIFAKRIDDKLGYGEILPSFALTEAPPPGAANPIYDEIAAYLAAHGPTAAPTAVPTAAQGTSTAQPPPQVPSSVAVASGHGYGPSAFLVAGGVGTVLVMLLAGLVVAARRGGRRTPGPG